MIRFTKIKWKNFLSTGGQFTEVKLDEHQTTLVIGENGAGLSLGQRQLVCFVRAMLADPRILILDEATSSVDTMTEIRIQKALSKLTKKRTCFVVAHRLSTVRHADLVLVLYRGRIIEQGTHLELLTKKGAYAELYHQFTRLGLGSGESKVPSPMLNTG